MKTKYICKKSNMEKELKTIFVALLIMSMLFIHMKTFQTNNST